MKLSMFKIIKVKFLCVLAGIGLTFILNNCASTPGSTATKSASKLVILDNPQVNFNFQSAISGNLTMDGSLVIPIEFNWIIKANRIVSFDSLTCTVNGVAIEKLLSTQGSKAVKKPAFTKLEFVGNRLRAPIQFKMGIINTVIVTINLEGDIFYIKHEVDVNANKYKIINEMNLADYNVYPKYIQNYFECRRIIKTNLNYFNLFITIPKVKFPNLKKNSVLVLLNNIPYGLNSNISIRSTNDTYIIRDSILLGTTAIQIVSVNISQGNNTLTLPKILLKKDQTYKPDLYLLSIGPQVPGLIFTAEDAKDFADLVNLQKNLPNRPFQNIYSDTIIGFNATKNKIDSSLSELVSKFDAFRENDLLILFVSSHGYYPVENKDRIKDGAKEFYILPSDCDPTDERNIPNRSISYSKINSSLNLLNCNKIIFLDACHSARAKSISSTLGNISNIIDHQIKLRSSTQLSVFSSSQKNEFSYEMNNLKNGVFTEILIQAVHEKPELTDKNKDNYISLNELFEYVNPNVKEYVKTELRSNQTPELFNSNLGAMRLFAIKEMK